MTRKFSIPVGLMTAAIVLIAAFQIYWLTIKIEEEKRILRIRTNILFRESVFELQTSRLKIDSAAKLRLGFPPDVARFADVVRKKLSDSLFPMPPRNRNVFLTLERPADAAPNDSIPGNSFRSGGRFFQFLVGIDSLQDSLRVADIATAYSNTLKKESINVPFSIIKKVEKECVREDEGRREWNKVVIGIAHPVSYTMELGSTFEYLLKQLLPQIIFSIFLIGLTITAFFVLYRNLKAQQRLTSIKNDFISNITHELKTPIATVSVAIEAIKNFNVLEQTERTVEYLDIAGHELNRLSMLVDKVLKLSMFEKQQVELQLEAFDIKQLTADIIASMGLQFEKAGAAVSLHTSGSNNIINADHLHITSVLYNLIDNALKYSGKKPVIDINVHCDEKECTLSVKDNGAGIAPEYRQKIFEKFFRIPAGDKHNIKGYGLGLSYVAHIVQQHRGTITLQSEPGHGCEFIVKLPVAHEQD